MELQRAAVFLSKKAEELVSSDLKILKGSVETTVSSDTPSKRTPRRKIRQNLTSFSLKCFFFIYLRRKKMHLGHHQVCLVNKHCFKKKQQLKLADISAGIASNTWF